jgi:hypothetical protein
VDGSLALVLLVSLVMAVGVVGTVVPLVPGLGLVAAAAVGYGLATGFGADGIVATTVIVALGLAGTAAGVLVPGRAAGRTGATRSSLALGALGAVVGFFVVPVVGLPLGGALGIYVGERLRSGEGAVAWRTTRATLLAFGLASLLQLLAGIAMVLTWVAWVLAS